MTRQLHGRMPVPPRTPVRPSLPFALLLTLLVVLWIAGGASRADVTGQVVVRAAAWGALVIAVLAGIRPSIPFCRPVLVILLAALGLVLLQLVPLPPSIWHALPGRASLDTSGLSLPQTWRSAAIVPGGAINAASSLMVPLAVLLLAASVDARERAWLPAAMLGLVVASMVTGLLQFSGGAAGNPFINDAAADMSGNFANRNHFALFLAFGCILAPVWAFLDDRRGGWRAPVAFGLVLLFMLSILGSGSRAGMVAGCLAVAIGLWIVRRGIRRELRDQPRWVVGAIIFVLVAITVILVLTSIAAGRAISIQRIFALDAAEDMRALGLPTVLSMVAAYFPVGTGFGGFDEVFRISEPSDLLSIRYFNHAHNDFLEVLLEGGIAGVAIVAAALVWATAASLRAWRSGSSLAQLGSATLLLVLLTSLVDYPARTPIIMATIIVSALWLNEPRRSSRSALPADGQQL